MDAVEGTGLLEDRDVWSLSDALTLECLAWLVRRLVGDTVSSIWVEARIEGRLGFTVRAAELLVSAPLWRRAFVMGAKGRKDLRKLGVRKAPFIGVDEEDDDGVPNLDRRESRFENFRLPA